VKKNNQARQNMPIPANPAPSPASEGRTPPRRRRQRHRARLLLLIIGVVVIALVFVTWLGVQALLNQINYVPPEEQTLPSEYNVPTESLVNPLPSMTGITNILLLGVDTRDTDPGSVAERSDSMMILTIDMNNKKLKLTSLQRDMLVYLPGKSEPVKLNAANARGGPALAMRVVNDTLRLDIKDFIVVNMRGMESLIDLAGGVMIDVTKDELPYLNMCVADENGNYPDTPQSPEVKSAGLQRLNGRQAVGYARIRKLDSDYKRMERQRTVLQALMDAFLGADLTTKGQVVTKGLSLLTTNLTGAELTEIALKVVPIMNGTIDQLQIPIDGYFTEDSGDTWVNRCDFNGMIPLLQTFIFGKTFDFDPVKVIAGAPHSGTPMPTKPVTKTPSATPHATTTATSVPTTSSTSGTTPVDTSGTSNGTTVETTVPTAVESTKHTKETTTTATSETAPIVTTTTSAA
jgi:polyisoprenyl-teichoic acid--peptidoglycan teichoic acid transferase